LSRAALRTDYKNGFSLSEFIVQIVEIVAFFPLVLFHLSGLGASVLKKVEADEHAYFVLMFGTMAVAGVFAQIVDLSDIVGSTRSSRFFRASMPRRY
jgi:Kef-type K+ transport system membrane component KefB